LVHELIENIWPENDLVYDLPEIEIQPHLHAEITTEDGKKIALAAPSLPIRQRVRPASFLS
jgi:hypothetical protein